MPGAEIEHRWVLHELVAEVVGLCTCHLVVRCYGASVGVLPIVLQFSLIERFLTSVPCLSYPGVLATEAEAGSALARPAVYRVPESLPFFLVGDTVCDLG